VRALLVAVALLLTGAACSSGDDTTEAAAVGVSASSSSSSTTTTLPPLTTYAVGERRMEVVDGSRPTAADPNRNLPAKPDRTLPVLVLFPAVGAASGEPTPVRDAPVADGRFPLVVFSHGVTASADVYAGRLKFWAQAGYVVAAPTFPLSSGAGGLISAYADQPGDVSFVIDELLLRNDEPDDPLYGHLDADHVGVAGHSLGAITTIGVAFNSCCHDQRIDAVVELSGVELPFPGGDYEKLPTIPLLAVHGASDGTVPVSGSDNLIAKAEPPTYYLRFPEGAHSNVLLGPEGALTDAAVIAFLDRHLKGDARRLAELPTEVASFGRATFEVKEAGDGT
jgi:predicted dienelactone hydrolase